MELDNKRKKAYEEILREELVPAMGCTEPSSVAYCAAAARELLGEEPTAVSIFASSNIIKNVKSVIVPNTGGLRGIEAAVAAGIVAEDSTAKLQILSEISPEKIKKIRTVLMDIPMTVQRTETDCPLEIMISLAGKNHTSLCKIAESHTNFVRMEKDGQPVTCIRSQEMILHQEVDRDLLNVQDIVSYAEQVEIETVRDVLEQQVRCNLAIAEEGLSNKWGAGIGRILLRSYGNSVNNRAKAYAAAGSDARMGGCELPVVINSGSGNQGITCSLPVVIYARELGVSREQMLRALIISNLVTIHLKTGIGRLSAYCGATSAGCGAGAGITYLYGGGFREISHTIVNALAINSGMICDGAKPSCAAKITSAVEAGLLGMQMQMHDSEFLGGDGIVVKGVENTIRNIGLLAREGMKETDREIVKLMLESL